MSAYHFHLGDKASAQVLIERYHYSALMPPTSSIVGTWHADGGLFGDSGEAVAACVIWPSRESRLRHPVTREVARDGDRRHAPLLHRQAPLLAPDYQRRAPTGGAVGARVGGLPETCRGRRMT